MLIGRLLRKHHVLDTWLIILKFAVMSDHLYTCTCMHVHNLHHKVSMATEKLESNSSLLSHKRGVNFGLYPMTSTCVSWEWHGWHYNKYTTVFSYSVFNTLFASIETRAHFEDVSLGQWTQRILKGNYDCNNLFFTNLHEPEAYTAYRQQRRLSRSTQ